jgi:hypothetical protein
MKKYFIILLSVFILICGCDSTVKSYKNPKPEVITPNENTPADPNDSKICHSVDNKLFLEINSGIWQSFRPGMVGPDCLHNRETSETTRRFIRIDRSSGKTYSFSVSYGKSFRAVQLCKESSMGWGTEQVKTQKHFVQLCQSKELVLAYGKDYYFMKTSNDLYQMVGTTTDTMGRLVLLIGWTKSSRPNVNDDGFQTFINHDDYRSVKIE